MIPKKLLLIVAVLIFQSCAHKAGIDAAQLLQLNTLSTLQDNKNTINTLCAALAEEAARRPIMELTQQEELIRQTSNSPEEALDSYKASLIEASTQINLAKEYYDQIAQTLIDAYIIKANQASTVAEKLATLQQQQMNWGQIVEIAGSITIDMAKIMEEQSKTKESTPLNKELDLVGLANTIIPYLEKR